MFQGQGEDVGVEVDSEGMWVGTGYMAAYSMCSTVHVFSVQVVSPAAISSLTHTHTHTHLQSKCVFFVLYESCQIGTWFDKTTR